MNIRVTTLSFLAVAGLAATLAAQTGASLRTVAQRLTPLAGTWTTSVQTEDGLHVVTIDGTAPRVLHPPALAALFGADAPMLAKSLSAPGAYPLAVAGDIGNFPGGRLQVHFKLVAGATDQTAGIFFNLTPNGDYLYGRYNTKDGNVAVWKFENGAREVLVHGELHEQLPLGEWHTLALAVSGGRVIVTANDRWRAEHTIGAPIAGRVGVWTKQDSVTSFRGFRASH